MTYVLSDIHGNMENFKSILKQIDLQLDDTLYILGDVIDRIKKALGVPVIKFTGSPERMIKKVAVCGGSGSDLIPKAAMRGADLLLTADVKYHDGQKADENDIAVVDAGHYYTEAIVVPVVADYLRAQMASSKRKADIITAEIAASDVFSFR